MYSQILLNRTPRNKRSQLAQAKLFANCNNIKSKTSIKPLHFLLAQDMSFLSENPIYPKCVLIKSALHLQEMIIN